MEGTLTEGNELVLEGTSECEGLGEVPDEETWDCSDEALWADVRDRVFWEDVPDRSRLLERIGWPRGKPQHARSHHVALWERVATVVASLAVVLAIVLASMGSGSARHARGSVRGSASTREAAAAAVSTSMKLLAAKVSVSAEAKEAYAKAAYAYAAAAYAHAAAAAQTPPPAPSPPEAPLQAASDATSTDTSDWACIRSHESDDNYSDSGGGAYQFEDATWQSVTGLAGSAQDYPPSTQDAAALALYDQDGWEPWTTRTVCGL
ncbi:MAG TPA: transglycosylase family protein [Acidimicrobiales bacterium]|nr:transglycosylase family protein [Acidimicrobiales bacterium]